jgi:hypothetical protein
MSLVTRLKFDGVELDGAWLEGPERRQRKLNWSAAGGGTFVSLLDSYLGNKALVFDSGRVTIRVHRMVYGFAGSGVVAPGGDGYTYELGKLALLALLADKPVGSNGDIVRVRFFGDISEKNGNLNPLAYAPVGNMDTVDTWAFRRANLATGAKSFCMCMEPMCTPSGRGPNPDTTTAFLLYTSKVRGPEGAASSADDLRALGTTCTLGSVLVNHRRDMAWWSFE